MLRGLQLGSSGKGIDEARLVELADVDETPRAASESEVAVGHEPDEEAGEEADASPPGAGPSGVESVITQVTSPGNALPGATSNFQQGGDQDDDDLDTQLRHALTELDRTTAHVCTLITKATTVHRTNDRPTNECTEALCTEAATAGRGGWCETDYARRYAWARRHRTEHPTRRDLLDAPPLTRETLADRAIRKRRQTA